MQVRTVDWLIPLPEEYAAFLEIFQERFDLAFHRMGFDGFFIILNADVEQAAQPLQIPDSAFQNPPLAVQQFHFPFRGPILEVFLNLFQRNAGMLEEADFP